ncbi:hypothetical protein KBY86_02390 [Synechococcus sp. Lug-A]|uniref:hypothetical protein n=1 Tax=unclassified Synechococcus TaxID=2626047 RepID=UPI0020CED5DB|nr:MULTISPECIES: hypothetical protein [unclassified Synechococcus]MCP9829011.1 hypothetical protein [Synechococcus sp. L2F]MCP9845747.1 hypothetical protein [Synechococcus sp. Lug-A]
MLLLALLLVVSSDCGLRSTFSRLLGVSLRPLVARVGDAAGGVLELVEASSRP